CVDINSSVKLIIKHFYESTFFRERQTLPIASKHAEGMSLRYDAICTLAYCGRHKSSHLPIKRGLGYLYLRFRISDY
ncbi:MAG: hypothetical protein UDD86_08545, partial [Sodaliphilus sp.]|nr:hypothetical protein [Sodaliphilus sp.]